MHLVDPVRCGRKTRSGGSCGSWAMHGQTVCRMHGGSSPQARLKAEERMRELVHPGITRLGELISTADSDAVTLNAIKYVLDWAGFRPADNAEAEDDGPIHVTVVFDRADQAQSPTFALNGYTPS